MYYTKEHFCINVLLHPKMKKKNKKNLFSHKLFQTYEFVSSVEHKIRYFKECP